MSIDPHDWILVVEDEPDIREIICMILESRGICAVGAEDGQEALDLLHGRPAPSLVILDLMMPRMDGWQFSDAVRDDPELAGIPIVVLSGDGQISAKASRLRAAGHVRKPVDMDELLAIIARHRRRGEPAEAPR
jgi:two-component system, chemotaxis family, chemotaxis protein CheY